MMLSFTIVCHAKFKWSPAHHRTVDRKPRICCLRLCALSSTWRLWWETNSLSHLSVSVNLCICSVDSMRLKVFLHMFKFIVFRFRLSTKVCTRIRRDGICCWRYVSVGSIIHQGSQSVYDNESWWTNLITSSRATAARIGVSAVRRHGCEKWKRYSCKNLFECYCVFSHTVAYTVHSRSFGIVLFIWWGSFRYLVHRGRIFAIWFGVCMYTRVEFILFATDRYLFCMHFVMTYSKGGGMLLDDLSEFLHQHKCRTDIKHVVVCDSQRSPPGAIYVLTSATPCSTLFLNPEWSSLALISIEQR